MLGLGELMDHALLMIGFTSKLARNFLLFASKRSGNFRGVFLQFSSSQVLFSFQKISYPSHRIFGHMHGALNALKK